MLPVLYKMVQSSLSLQPRFYTNYLSVFLEIWKWVILSFTPAGTYLLKVSNRNTRTRCKICSKLTINRVTPCSSVSIINFEHVFAGWDTILKQNFLRSYYFSHLILQITFFKIVPIQEIKRQTVSFSCLRHSSLFLKPERQYVKVLNYTIKINEKYFLKKTSFS